MHRALAISGGRDVMGHRLDLTASEGALVEDAPSNIVFDATGLTVAPGYIDLQVNGAFGNDFTTDPESIWRAAARLPETGVTGFLPTLITAPGGTVQAAQAALGRRPDGFVGADPLGLHVEGPMLSHTKRGAHPPQYLVARASAHDWSPANGITLVTLAPELPGALDAIGTLTDRGVVVSLGHSDASSVVAAEGADAGATFGTHLFNAMSLPTSREPGLAGFLLTDDRMHFGMINDDVHLDRRIVQLIWKAAGDRMILVTDAIAATGIGDGTYRLGSLEITVNGMIASRADGGLGGSVLTMDRAVRNLIEITGCTLEEAVAAATERPASLMHLSSRGALKTDNRADVVLLDREAKVAATIASGRVAYVSDPDRLSGDAYDPS